MKETVQAEPAMELPDVPAFDKDTLKSATSDLRHMIQSSPENEKKAEEFIKTFRDSRIPLETFWMYYECAIMEIKTKFNVLNRQLSLHYDGNPIESIKARMKSIDSLALKVIRKNIPWTLEAVEENINDIAGIRVVCSFEEDIYRLADSFLRQDDITLIEMKDYIKNLYYNFLLLVLFAMEIIQDFLFFSYELNQFFLYLVLYHKLQICFLCHFLLDIF